MTIFKKPVQLIAYFMLCLFSPIVIFAQQPLNFDFEINSVEDNRPWGWEITTWEASTFEKDSVQIKQGDFSLRSSCDAQVASCSPQFFNYGIEPLDFKGKSISIFGYIKGEDLDKGANFSVNYTYLDSKSGETKEEEVFSKAGTGTFDWQKFSINTQFPQSIVRLNLRMNREGGGVAWFDDFEIMIENKITDFVNVAEAYSQSNLNWLIEKSNSFNSPLPISSENDFAEEDLSFFKEAVGNSRIIALGESTHGTSEFFSLKHKLLQYAVQELGFRIFAIEDHQIIARNVDRYVKTGVGTAHKSMKGLFAVWQRQEVITMIRWIRQYNKEHPDDMVSFVGFDMQNINPPIDSLSSFLRKWAPALSTELDSEIQDLKEKGNNYFMERDTLVKLDWVKRAEKIHDKVNEQRELLFQTTKNEKDVLEIEYGVQSANMIRQFFREALHNGQEFYRDVAMAENVSWNLEKTYPNSKMVIWAHDVHISKGEYPIVENNMHYGVSMGSFLAKKYGDNYKSFGISTYSGTYRAFKTYAYLSLIECPLFESPKGSLEEAMHQICEIKGKKNLFLPLPKTEDWLNKPVPVRFANHVSFDYGYWPRFSVPYQFDGLFFIDETNSAQDIKSSNDK